MVTSLPNNQKLVGRRSITLPNLNFLCQYMAKILASYAKFTLIILSITIDFVINSREKIDFTKKVCLTDDIHI